MFGEKMDDIFEDVLGFLKGLYNKNQSELISKSSRPLTLVEETGFLIWSSLLSLYCHDAIIWQNHPHLDC